MYKYIISIKTRSGEKKETFKYIGRIIDQKKNCDYSEYDTV